MTLEQAREAVKGAGEFSHVTTCSRDLSTVELHFVQYQPGARNGRFHRYNSVAMPREVYDLLRSELKKPFDND